MEELKKFFWICSGANKDLLVKCPTEASKYAGIGATIFFTGLFAALAGAYALYTVFDSIWIAGLFGIVWGLMIFNLDRYIVSSMRKDRRFAKEFTTALPRIFLAVIISLVIAKPLEMKIFDKELKAELRIMEQEIFAKQEEQVRKRFLPEIERNAAVLASLKSEIEEKAILRNKLNEEARAEADGTGGSMRRNAGPIYMIKKADAEKAEQELAVLMERNHSLIEAQVAKGTEQESLLQQEILLLEQSPLDGPAARLEALDRLASRSSAIWWANFFIILLFLAVESAPVLVKLISPRGPYDDLLKVSEYKFEVQRAEDTSKINVESKVRTSDFPEFERTFVEDRLETGLKST